MATTSKLVKACTSSEIKPFVVVLKLLIFLALHTEAVSSNSVSLEGRNLQIPALGRISNLGCLYDARTNSFSDANIFQSTLPIHLITTTNTPRMTKKSQIIKKESDKFKIFGVDLDTAASIQMGIVQPEGAASLMSEDMTSPAGVTGVFLHTFQTAKQTFSILQGEPRDYYHTDFQLFEGATHIVTGIHWGGSIAVTFADTPLGNQSRTQKRTLMGKEMAKLKKTKINFSNKTVSFEMHLTSDGSPTISFPAPTSLSEIQNQINQLQESVTATNSGLGLPLKFTLTPISVLKKYLNVTTTLEPRAHEIDERTLREYLNVIDDIRSTSMALTKLEENSHCVPNEVHRELERLQGNFEAAEQDFEILFKNVFLDVKSGDCNNSALAQVLRNYKNQVSNPKTVRASLDLHQQALMKVDFCSQLNEEYPDIQYFGSDSNLVSTIYRNRNKPTYVLFTKSESEENDRGSYEDNLNIFLNLLYKPSNALFIVDCDFSYSQCESINRTVIKQIRKGKYTFDDVRMEMKILEMENKTDIVECNKESGITGALCVSTIGITSAKLKAKPLHRIKEKPEESRRSNKVVGGNTANPNEFPFQVLFLRNATGVHCGGTILNENSILTAAHCLHEEDYILYDAEEYESWTIVAGDHNWQLDEGTEQRRKIRELHVHKKYIPISEVNDIAIVQLDRPLQWSAAVQPILLPDSDYEASGNAIVTGWGRLQSGGTNPLALQKVTVPIVDRADCVEAYEEDQVFVSVKMLCAGHLGVGGVDACQGDSGGPLSVQLSNGSSMLVGVVSGGIGCARPEYPGIYMQVSKYVDWIKGILQQQFVCEQKPCLNGGKCSFKNDEKHCECSLEFVGDNCETNNDDCAGHNSCQNGGTCVDGVNSFTCDCAVGYNGIHCETDIDNCAGHSLCQHEGTCLDGVNSFTCDCAVGYNGIHCETDIDDCAGHNRCQNGGTCVDGVNSFTCDCAVGYNGIHCETDIDDCAGYNRCQNGGTCVDGVNSFSCDCAVGYNGIHCETGIDDCAGNNRCQNGGTCVDGTNTFTCVCTKSFIGNHCEHLNECAYPGTCRSLSTLSRDAKCRCREGYAPDPHDSRSCEPVNKNLNENATLIFGSWGDDGGVDQLSLSQQKVTRIQNHSPMGYALDVMYRTNTMFWSDTIGNIYNAPIRQGAAKTVVLSDSGSSILSLAVDWVYGHLYFSDSYRDTISVANLDGSMKKVLFKTGVPRTWAIVVDPLSGWMYRADFDAKNIERAALDGSQREVIANTEPKYPVGLALDLTQNRLYWTTYYHPASIHSMNVDGSDQKLVYEATQPTFSSSNFWSITTFGDFVYWREYYTKGVYRTNKCGGEGATKIHSTASQWDPSRTLQAYHFSKQPKGVNYCENRIGGQCSHLCFRIPSTGNQSGVTKCACPDGRALSSDQRTCT